MAYFHPRDFDNNIHKMFHGSPYLQLRYRVGTNSSQKKMKHFVKDFNFLTIGEALKKVDWNRAKVLNLVDTEK